MGHGEEITSEKRDNYLSKFKCCQKVGEAHLLRIKKI